MKIKYGACMYTAQETLAPTRPREWYRLSNTEMVVATRRRRVVATRETWIVPTWLFVIVRSYS